MLYLIKGDVMKYLNTVLLLIAIYGIFVYKPVKVVENNVYTNRQYVNLLGDRDRLRDSVEYLLKIKACN